MTRILVLTPWWPREEADPFGSFVRDQARALARLGADVRVGVVRTLRSVTIGDGRRVPLSKGDPPTTIVMTPALPYRACHREWLMAARRGLSAAVARQGRWVDQAVLLVHTQEMAVPARIVARRAGRPFVVVAHGLEPDSPRYESRCRRTAYVRALEAAARVIAVGPGLARHLAMEAPLAEVTTVLNGYSEERVAALPSPPPRDSEPRLVCVSNLCSGKGVEKVIEALGQLRDAGVRVPSFDVVGDGPAREALVLGAARAGVTDRVRFHGRKSPSDALRIVRGATAFVLPSQPEACGIAYLEAMALGVPPVAVRGEGPSAFVEDGVDGLLCEATAGSVALVIRAFLDDPTLSRRLGDEARRKAAHHGWDEAARELLAALPKTEPAPTRERLWLALYNEPTPYVATSLNHVEMGRGIRLRRAWLSEHASQDWGRDAAIGPDDVLRGPRDVGSLAWRLVRGRVHGVLSGGWGGSPLMPFLLACAWIARRPLVIQSDTHMSNATGLRALARRTYLRVLDRRTRCWLAAGTPQAEHLRATVRLRAPVVVEHMTVDTAFLAEERARLGDGAGSAWRRAHGIPEDAALVLYVGRIAPEKGIEDLLIAVGLLAREGCHVRLAVVGPGSLRVPPEVADGSALFVATGRIPWRDLVPAYLAADVFVLPSRIEPWGLVVNEALALGCPVVTTEAVGAARDLVANGGTGVVVPPANPPALAAAIREVLDRGGRRSTYARRAVSTMSRWTMSKTAGRIRRILLNATKVS